MRRRGGSWTLATLVAAGLSVSIALTGCAPPAPVAEAPKTTPSPTFYCTAEPGGTPAECSPEAYSEQVRLDVLYAEATKNYQRFFTENVKLLRAGGVDKATANLLAVAGGPYLDATVTNLRQLQELGVRAGPGDIRLVRLDRSPGATTRGYDVALNSCVDSRGVPLLQGDVEVKPGSAYAETVYFKRDAGVLKLWDAEGQRVEGC